MNFSPDEVVPDNADVVLPPLVYPLVNGNLCVVTPSIRYHKEDGKFSVVIMQCWKRPPSPADLAAMEVRLLKAIPSLANMPLIQPPFAGETPAEAKAMAEWYLSGAKPH